MRYRRFANSLVAPAGFIDPGAVASLEATATLEEPPGPTHDPPLEPRDEAAFLLKAAAEVEHMLMVHYLFAAYSLKPKGEHQDEIKGLQNGLLQIAREEMGHLITVQNLLLLIGAPLNFHREHSPYASEIYPFRFKLEPLSLDSLAKYVVAESPVRCPPEMDPERWTFLVETIQPQAEAANDGCPVMHVGPIFARLRQLFENQDGNGLQDADFRHAGNSRQGRFEDWGYDPQGKGDGEPLIVDSFEAEEPEKVRDAAIEAIQKISDQGEGFDPPTTGPESHFERFFNYYDRVAELIDQGVEPAWPLTTNPNTTKASKSTSPGTGGNVESDLEAAITAHETQGRITNPRSRQWAQLLNARYRLLLMFLSHFLHLDEELYVGSGPKEGDRTRRGLLLAWTFDEMRRLRKLSRKLVQLPKDEEEHPMRAGPPFELPYSLQLPAEEADRWRLHLDASLAASRLVVDLRAGGAPDDEDKFLIDLERLDAEAQKSLRALAAGQSLPEDALPTDFQKVVHILEEAVRGFSIGRHGNFWDGLTREQFVGDSVGTVGRLVSEDFDPDTSRLVQQIEKTIPKVRMPRFRPPILEERIGYIRDWIQAEAPDNEPKGQPGIVRERDPRDERQPSEPDPPADQPLSFATHIRDLFRQRDREAMLLYGSFDLHQYEDVRENAERILATVEAGSMPCDSEGKWPAERVDLFRRWIDQGMSP